MLRAEELSSMQAAVNASLPEVATQKRNSPASDGMGGATDNYVVLGTLLCRVRGVIRHPLESTSTGKTQTSTAETVQTVTRFSLMLPYNAGVKPADLLVVGSNTYKVMDINAPSEAIEREALCELIT